jgi:hypothetical protein
MKLGVLVTFAALIAATAIAATGAASTSAEDAQSPLVGTWRRTTTCAELVAAAWPAPVDGGTYRITRPGTIVIFKEFPKVTFTYRITGKTIRFTSLVPKGRSSFRCAWAVAVAYPGKTWQRR